MTVVTPRIQSGPILPTNGPNSRFALDNEYPLASASLGSSAAVVPQGPTVVAPKPVPVLRSRTPLSATSDNFMARSQHPVCDFPNMFAPYSKAALKRPPKLKNVSSPGSSYLRPVSVPPAWRSPTTSPEPKLPAMEPVRRTCGEEEIVTSLSDIFRTQTSKPLATRPPRPQMMTSHSNSVVVKDAPPVIPSRNINPTVSYLRAQSPALLAARQGRLASNNASSFHPHDETSSSNGPNILVTSPSMHLAQHVPWSHNSALFMGEDTFDFPSNSDPSLTDAESRISEAFQLPTVKSGRGGESAFGDPDHELPPVHRAHSPSDEETGYRFHNIGFLPDSSCSSRRPPSLPDVSLGEHSIRVPSHPGHMASAGSSVVVASGHHIKCYDLSSGESSWILDTRDGMHGSVVSYLEFKPALDLANRGHYIWVGTKEGHLFEVDIRLGIFTSCIMGIHASQVTHIFRQGLAMLTIDETGKAFVFDPSNNRRDTSDDVHLLYTAPRACQLGEKIDFAKLLGGLLWTSARTELNGIGTTSVPVIRIYDVFTSGSVGHSVTPTHHVGAVTSGAVIPSQHDLAYLGHEGGFISVWDTVTDSGTPTCIAVVQVGTSDVLSLEGVNDSLWAGWGNGTISVYNVHVEPWAVTNSWDAHGGLPVSRIFVDPCAVDLRDKLCVVSVGRDEKIRFWDGLIGVWHIEQELLKREHTFTTFRGLKVLIVSWNIDAAKPESLVGEPENARFLHDVLTSADSPDIISFGFQEVIDLESSTMAMKTILLGGKKKGEGGIDENVTSSYRKWHDRLVQEVKQAMPPESLYTVAHTESLVGLLTCMFVKDTEKASLSNPAITTLKRGLGGHYGNKGGIIARFLIDDSSLAFVNCHLAAGQHHVHHRNADVTAFLEEAEVFPRESDQELRYVDGGDGSMVLDHEIVFVNGDMNYRIDQPRDTVVGSIEANHLDALVAHDQLHKEMKHNHPFRLRAFREGPLTFAPTYKYDRHSNDFDTSEKQRVPAWCDRVLWRSREEQRVRLLDYRRWEPNVSDHRPISASFQVTVKRVVREAREREKRAVEAWWEGREWLLLAEAKRYYEV